MVDLARQKKRWPSVRARFCTEELKIKPTIDYVLDEVQDNMLMIQGIRGAESPARAKMSAQCTYFKYYLEPYGYDKNGKPRKRSYRGKEVRAFSGKVCRRSSAACLRLVGAAGDRLYPRRRVGAEPALPDGIQACRVLAVRDG